MSLTKKSKLSLLLILISAVFSYLVVYPLGFPKFGLSFSLAAFAIIAYKLKKNKTKNTRYLLLFTILFALFIFIRSEEFITFLNILATLYFGSLMILSSENNNMTALKVVTAPFSLIFKSLTGKNVYRLEYKTPSYFQSTKLNLTDAAITLAISFFVLLIIPPLLASANPIFAGWLKDIVEMFSLNFLLEFMRTLNGSTLILRLLFFTILIILIPRMLTYMNEKDKQFVSPFNFRLDLLIPKILVASILILFFITQFQLYFASRDTLIELGYTYSEYTNEVFAQLSVVSLIIIWLLYISSNGSKYSRKLNYLLITEGIFLTMMAFKSDFEYSSTFGFTYKRLYGFAVVSLIFGILLMQLWSYYKKLDKSWFIKSSVFYLGLILLLINVLNFDYLIYHYRKSVTERGVDYQYLSGLSADSLSYKDQIEEIDEKITNEKNINNQQIYNAGFNLVRKTKNLQSKYEELHLRSFSLYEYLQYQQIKDINIEEFEEKLNLLPIQPLYYR